MYQHECFLTPKENFQGSKSHLAQNFIFSDPLYSCSVLLWSSCWHVFISFNIWNCCNFTFMCCTKGCWRQWRIIPLPLTEESWAPLVAKYHCLGRILDPWLPVDSDMTSVNQSALCPESCGCSGVKAAIVALGLHTLEGLARFSGANGVQELVQRARQPHTRLGRACEMLAGAGLGLRALQPMGQWGCLRWLLLLLGKRYIQLPFLERESWGFGKGLGKQPRNKEGREKCFFSFI